MMRVREGREEIRDSIPPPLNNFNPFLALRIANREISHSAFLRWLFDPIGTHGQEDRFLIAFLCAVRNSVKGEFDHSPTAKEISNWSMRSAKAITEWKDIDILIRDDANRFICVIENKWNSREHGNQLKTYRNKVEATYVGYRKLFVFLTKEGIQPENDPKYIPFSYTKLIESIDSTQKDLSEKASLEARAFISQYIETVRNGIEDHGQESLSGDARNSIDSSQLNTQGRNNKQNEVMEVLKGCLDDRILNRGDIILDVCNLKKEPIIRFLPTLMDMKELRVTDEWTSTRRILLWELKTERNSNRLKMVLYLGPGDNSIRIRIKEAASRDDNCPPFCPETPIRDRKGREWVALLAIPLLDCDQYDAMEYGRISHYVNSWIDQIIALRACWMKKVITDAITANN